MALRSGRPSTKCDLAQYSTVTTEGRKEEEVVVVATVDTHMDKAPDEQVGVRDGPCASDHAFAILGLLSLPFSVLFWVPGAGCPRSWTAG